MRARRGTRVLLQSTSASRQHAHLLTVSCSPPCRLSIGLQHFGPIMNRGGAILALSFVAAERVVPGYGGGMSSAKSQLESDVSTQRGAQTRGLATRSAPRSLPSPLPAVAAPLLATCCRCSLRSLLPACRSYAAAPCLPQPARAALTSPTCEPLCGKMRVLSFELGRAYGLRINTISAGALKSRAACAHATHMRIHPCLCLCGRFTAAIAHLLALPLPSLFRSLRA